MMVNACADEISAEILDLQRNDTESGREFADPATQQKSAWKIFTIFNASGIITVKILQKMTTAKKGSLRLIGMRNVVRETFSLTGFNALFKIEDAK